MKTFYIENLGCAKNQVDAEIMVTSLQQAGWQRVAEPDSAGIIIVNSCGFIEPAKQESIDTVLQFSDLYPESRIVMAGCLSQRYPDEIARELPELHGITGNRAPDQIAEFLQHVEESGERVFVPQASGLPDVTRNELLSFPGSAYVKVAEGCNNRCSFCAIPQIRGALRSRSVRSIANEVRHLLTQGVREFNLVAQDLASYGTDRGEQLPSLIQALLEIDGDFWIRPLYVYPEHFPEELLDFCESDPRILPYFDIPLQHASPAILKRMGRPDEPEKNLRLIDHIRERLPHAFVRSTFLVGFYGETNEDFDQLLEFQERAQIDWLGAFTYSPEEGTPAMRYEGTLPLPGPEAEERKQRLLECQLPITQSRVDRLVGNTFDVLIEEPVYEEAMALGRLYAHAPEVDGAVVVTGVAHQPEPGRFLPCRVTRRNGLDVEAVPI